jgi:hypothetical protein
MQSLREFRGRCRAASFDVAKQKNLRQRNGCLVHGPERQARSVRDEVDQATKRRAGSGA